MGIRTGDGTGIFQAGRPLHSTGLTGLGLRGFYVTRPPADRLPTGGQLLPPLPRPDEVVLMLPCCSGPDGPQYDCGAGFLHSAGTVFFPLPRPLRPASRVVSGLVRFKPYPTDRRPLPDQRPTVSLSAPTGRGHTAFSGTSISPHRCAASALPSPSNSSS